MHVDMIYLKVSKQVKNNVERSFEMTTATKQTQNGPSALFQLKGIMQCFASFRSEPEYFTHVLCICY